MLHLFLFTFAAASISFWFREVMLDEALNV